MKSLLTKSQAVYFLKKIFIALGLASFLMFLSIFPNVGYFGSAHVDRGNVAWVYINPFVMYGIVNYTYDITYNPFLFPFTWLRGDGCTSGSSSMVTLPKSIVMRGPFAVPILPNQRDIEEDAVIKTVNLEIPPNFLTLFAITLAIEFTKMRSLFVCLVVGTIGFIPGGPLGTIAGLFTGVFIVVFLITRKNKESKSRQMA